MADAHIIDILAARYVSLVTFRRDGREVATPVWFAEHAGRLYAYSRRDAGKVKRIRANGRMRLAPCTMKGEIVGEWVQGRAKVVDDPAVERAAYAALARKYGLVYRVTTLMARLTGRIARRAVLELELGT